MKRRIVRIDQEKCNGCGACARACHEGAIAIIDGKAKLLRDDYCDGLGDCLPACPTGAISFEEREAVAYNENAVLENKAKKKVGACPGVAIMSLNRKREGGSVAGQPSELINWPLQIKLLPTHAPYFADADLLIAADCTAFAYSDFHRDFIKGHITLIGCPKLDDVDYSEKLGEIIADNDIHSVTVVRMQVPCCGGISYAAEKAIAKSKKNLPLKVIVIAADGQIIS